MKILLFLSLAVLGVACNDEEDPYEALSKLRALGAGATPVVGQPSTATVPSAVTLTFYAAVPTGDSVEAKPYVDANNIYGFPLTLTAVEGSETVSTKSSMDLYSVQFTGVLPSEDLLFFDPVAGYARLRYGVTLTSNDEEENIVGDYLVYPADSDAQSWKIPDITIAKPAQGESVSGEVDLVADLLDYNDEPVRIGWFVTDGSIKNRKSTSTEWDSSSGPQTVIVTARGRLSGAFNMSIVTVNDEE